MTWKRIWIKISHGNGFFCSVFITGITVALLQFHWNKKKTQTFIFCWKRRKIRIKNLIRKKFRRRILYRLDLDGDKNFLSSSASFFSPVHFIRFIVLEVAKRKINKKKLCVCVRWCCAKMFFHCLNIYLFANINTHTQSNKNKKISTIWLCFSLIWQL